MDFILIKKIKINSKLLLSVKEKKFNILNFMEIDNCDLGNGTNENPFQYHN